MPDERGSLPVVLSIVFVVVLLSVALANRVIGDFDNVNLESYVQQARAAAQSGVADALFQIDQQGSSPASSFCNAAGTSCSLQGVPGASGVVYKVAYDASSQTYTVLSKATVRRATYAVQATVKRTPIVADAVYGGAYVTFDGRSTTAVTVTDQYGNAVPGAKAGIAVGPGGTLTCNGPADPNAIYVNYGGSISKCTPYQNLGPIYAPQQPSQACPPPMNPYGAPPTPCLPMAMAQPTPSPVPPNEYQPCLNASPGNVTGTDATGYVVTGTVASPAMLEPGIYLCRGGLTMVGVVNVDYGQNPKQNGGRVQIYVFPPVGSTTSPNVSVRGASVNVCETIGTAPTGICKGGLVGDPTDLEIFSWGSGTADLGSSLTDAVLWAPGMYLTLHGAADPLTWTGGLILGGVTANGHPSFNLNFDQRLQNEWQQSSWQITNYIQVSPSSFTVP